MILPAPRSGRTVEVSVVIPTRNRSTLLRLALGSVLRQRHVVLEVIVVDEASSDDTRAVVARFGDARVRVIRHDRPQGVSAARNRGVAESRADWIAFLDDDDLWAPDKLALQLQAAKEAEVSWVYVGHVNINSTYRVTGGSPPLAPERLLEELPRHNVVPGGCSGVMACRRALEDAGLFDPRLQTLADWDLWLRLAGGGRPAFVSKPLVAYRLHGGQMSLDASRAQEEFGVIAQRNSRADLGILFRYLGWWALRVKNHRDALKFFIRAWAQRKMGSTTRTLATDLMSVARDAIEHRVGVRMPRVAVMPEHESWRAQGQAWVDALIASTHAAVHSSAYD